MQSLQIILEKAAKTKGVFTKDTAKSIRHYLATLLVIQNGVRPSNLILKVFLGKTYDVSQYDSQRSHPSMDLGVKWDLCVLFVQTTVKCQDCKFV